MLDEYRPYLEMALDPTRAGSYEGITLPDGSELHRFVPMIPLWPASEQYNKLIGDIGDLLEDHGPTGEWLIYKMRSVEDEGYWAVTSGVPPSKAPPKELGDLVRSLLLERAGLLAERVELARAHGGLISELGSLMRFTIQPINTESHRLAYHVDPTDCDLVEDPDTPGDYRYHRVGVKRDEGRVLSISTRGGGQTKYGSRSINGLVVAPDPTTVALPATEKETDQQSPENSQVTAVGGGTLLRMPVDWSPADFGHYPALAERYGIHGLTDTVLEVLPEGWTGLVTRLCLHNENLPPPDSGVSIRFLTSINVKNLQLVTT